MELREKQLLFAREYPELFDFIYRCVCYRIPERDDAEEVVSETFSKAYARLSDFSPDLGSFRQWLSGIARNEVLMHWRSRKRLVSLEIVEEPVDAGLGHRLMELLDRRMLTEKIFARLSPETKALVTLRYVEELSYEELAEITGRDPAALRQFFSRLHRTLRISFEEPHINFLSL
jgi:RNA polymerase sigma-70 factor (ECF subfamily)